MIPRTFWLFFFCWSIDRAFRAVAKNVDDENPLVFHSPFNSTDDYFGFSVSLVAGQKYRKYWFFVGAPRALHEDLIKGQSYLCYLSPDGIGVLCDHLPVTLTYPSLKNEAKIYLNNSLYGSSQDAGVNNGLFATCSPHLQTMDSSRVSRMNGVCFVGSTKKPEYYINLEPFANKERAFDTSRGKVTMKDLVFGQSGFSTRILYSNVGQLQLLVGAPNVHEGKGTVVLYNLVENTTTNHLEAGKPAVPPTGQISDYAKGQRLYLGYSVSSGNYFKRQQTFYASGSPNYGVKGSVLIFNVTFENETISKKQILFGTQVGESFGYSLASGDISRDKLDELIVGAPYYTTSTDGQNEGRVVVFTKSKSNLLIEKYELKGTVAKGYFGTTVAFLGDLDNDKFGDFAVAAPYEGGGVVYLYYGTNAKESLVKAKKILGTNYEPSMARFGFSISRGVDVDQNGYLDFAVGAYISGHVVLFRTRPAVKLRHELKLVEDYLTYNSTEFTISSCVRYIGYRVPKKLTFHLKLELLGTAARRIFYRSVEDNHKLIEDNVTLMRNVTGCKNFKFLFRANMTDYESPFKVAVQYFIPRNDTPASGKMKVTTLAPVIAYPTLREVEATFASMCIKDSCIADLRLDLRFYRADTGAEITSYVIGSGTSLLVRVTLTNLGMPALGSKLLVAYPHHLQPTIFGRCHDMNEDQEGINELQCSVFTPLLANKTETVELRFGSAVIDAEKKIPFSARAISRSNLTDSSVVVQEKELRFESEAALGISGSSVGEQKRFDLFGNAKQSLTLKFIVEKYGASPVQDAKISINFPYATFNEKQIFGFNWTVLSSSGECAPEEADQAEDEGEVVSTEQSAEGDSSEEHDDGDHRRKKRYVQRSLLTNRTLLLDCSSQVWQCKSITCRLGKFDTRSTHVTVNVTMQIDFSHLRKELGPKDYVQIEAGALVEILKPKILVKPKELRPCQTTVVASFQRVIKNRDYFQDPFILGLSATIGLFLLLLLVLGLSKAGFFVRDDMRILQEKMRMQRPPIASLKDLQIMYDRCDTSDRE